MIYRTLVSVGRAGMRSASTALGLLEIRSEDANCNRWPVVFCRWTTSLEQSTRYCSRY